MLKLFTSVKKIPHLEKKQKQSSYSEGEESPRQAPPNFKFSLTPQKNEEKKTLIRVRVRKYGYVKEFAGGEYGYGLFKK